MSTAPEEEPQPTPEEEPDSVPSEEDPEEPGIGSQETRPVTEPDVEGDPDLVAPDPVEDA